MKTSTTNGKLLCLMFAVVVIQTASSTRSNIEGVDSGWDSEPRDQRGFAPADEEFSETDGRASLTDLLMPSLSSRSMEGSCNFEGFMTCARRVAAATSTKNATYANCRSVLTELLDPETFQRSKLIKVCRAYTEVNLCAEQSHCEMNSVLQHIERNKKIYHHDLKYCYEKSREVCTDVDLAPEPSLMHVIINNSPCCCFGDKSTVLTEDGRTLKMAELSVGDRVLTADPETGTYYYDEVITFQHRDENNSSQNQFIHLTLADDADVSLTPYHLIYVATKEEIYSRLGENQTTFGQPKFAIDVKPGDYVFTVSDTYSKHESIEVVAVNLKYEYSGLHTPLTTSGNIVVDGVLMSCYASVSSHRFAHWVWAPVRIFHQISTYLSSFTPLSFDWFSTHTDEGIHRYGDVLLKVAGYLPFTESFFPSSP